MKLSSDVAKLRFNYDAKTGIVTYSGRERENNPPSLRSKRTGRIAGWKDTAGHLNVKIKGKDYLLHRVIWLMVTGEWPDGHIDHINGIKHDNRWENIRLVDVNTNVQNLHMAYSNSSSGVLGVSPGIKKGTWLANIRVNKIPIRLGTFNSIEEARDAYMNAKSLLHPDAEIVKCRKVDFTKFTKTAIKNLKKAGYWPAHM